MYMCVFGKWGQTMTNRSLYSFTTVPVAQGRRSDTKFKHSDESGKRCFAKGLQRQGRLGLEEEKRSWQQLILYSWTCLNYCSWFTTMFGSVGLGQHTTASRFSFRPRNSCWETCGPLNRGVDAHRRREPRFNLVDFHRTWFAVITLHESFKTWYECITVHYI